MSCWECLHPLCLTWLGAFAVCGCQTDGNIVFVCIRIKPEHIYLASLNNWGCSKASSAQYGQKSSTNISCLFALNRRIVKTAGLHQCSSAAANAEKKVAFFPLKLEENSAIWGLTRHNHMWLLNLHVRKGDDINGLAVMRNNHDMTHWMFPWTRLASVTEDLMCTYSGGGRLTSRGARGRWCVKRTSCFYWGRQGAFTWIFLGFCQEMQGDVHKLSFLLLSFQDWQ